VLSAVAFGDQPAAVLKAAEDGPDPSVAMVTAIHDASVHLGAQCVVPPSDTEFDSTRKPATRAGPTKPPPCVSATYPRNAIEHAIDDAIANTPTPARLPGTPLDRLAAQQP
jgi:hypothetical protein